MKRTILLSAVIFLVTIVSASFGQSNKKSVEVLYFKANLACCKARACNALQNDVDAVIVKYFLDENIQFNVVKLADEANKDLVEKYHAKSQTVVIVSKKKKKENSTDVSDIVANYSKTRNKAKFENEMKAKINEILKM
ncbi:MAG: hypothetical protein K0B08_12340 [Bacteroidales bacterium]|nr:hypothetical protein [Bacteroidales bacterium]